MKRISRRDFNRGMAASVILAPFIKPTLVSANSNGGAKFCISMVSMAPDPDQYTPRSGSDIFNTMSEPLRDIADDITLVYNASITSGGHGSPAPLAAVGHGGRGSSIETFIGSQLSDPGLQQRLLLGVKATAGGEPWFLQDGNRVAPTESPAQAYEEIFGVGAAGVSTMAATADGGDMMARLRQKKSILDVIKEDIASLKTKLDAVNIARLDAHLNSIREYELEIEKRLKPMGGGGGGGGGGMPLPPIGTPEKPTVDGSTIDDALPLHMDMAAYALASGYTRSVGISVGNHQNCVYNKIPGAGECDHHSGVIHGAHGGEKHKAIEKWLIEQYIRLVNKLKALPMPDGSGSVYDHSMIVWARDFGHPDQHSTDRAVYVVSGGAGGYLRKQAGGLAIDAKGAAHQAILLTMADAMGITDVAGFGSLAEKSIFSELKKG